MNSFSSIPFKKNFGFSLLCKLNANISKLNLKKFNLIKHKFTTTENTTEFSNKDKKRELIMRKCKECLIPYIDSRI